MFMAAAQGKREVDADIQAMTKALGVWAKKNNITPRQFEEAMGWRYGHSWDVLNGKQPFSPAAWGKFQRAYGMKEFLDVARIAGVDFTKRGSDV